MSQREYVRKLDSHSFAKRKDIWQLLHLDPLLVLLLLILTGFGLTILYSAGGHGLAMVERQALFFVMGYIVMIGCAFVPPLFYRRAAPILYLAGIILLLMVLLLGDHSKGAQRWLEIPGLPRFQPSELLKIVMPLTVAWYLAPRVLPPRLKYIVAVLLMVAIPVLLIALQPDLGTAILVGSSGIFVLLIAGIRWRYVLFAVLIVLISAPLMWQFGMHDYQKTRVMTLLDPERDRFGAGWNIWQSKTAIGSGGWDGKGYMQGTQSQLNFLPESHTDFIVAVLAEEWGMLGVLCLLFLYLLIIMRMMVLAWMADTLFNKLVIASMALTFFVYVFVNIGMVSGLLPVVGVPLPFISRGGTSIISLMVAFGIVMALAHDKKQFSNN